MVLNNNNIGDFQMNTCRLDLSSELQTHIFLVTDHLRWNLIDITTLISKTELWIFPSKPSYGLSNLT